MEGWISPSPSLCAFRLYDEAGHDLGNGCRAGASGGSLLFIKLAIPECNKFVSEIVFLSLSIGLSYGKNLGGDILIGTNCRMFAEAFYHPNRTYPQRFY